jgi:RND family efflux transporter MFP subunit
MKLRTVVVLLGLAGLGAAAYQTGALEPIVAHLKGRHEAGGAALPKPEAPVPTVSVVRVDPADFVETVLVTGSFAAREEIMVAPEVDGLRVLELKAEEGDHVRKGDLLAVLVTEQLEAQLAANQAALAAADAAIERSKSQIAEAEARSIEADAQLERARPLVRDKYLSESVFDQRQAAARAAVALLAVAKNGLAQAEAEKVQVEAQRRELAWKRGNAEIRAPADGLISRRAGRIGSIATASALAGGDTMFRIVKDGEIELDAEVTETSLYKVKPGQSARVTASGGVEATGTVRLVSPEVDKTTRLGHVRIFIGDRSDLKIGSFGRGTIETSKGRAIAVPLSAVLYGDGGATIQVVVDNKVETRRVTTGLEANNLVEILSGVSEGDLVVAKAGTFLRDGDAVRPVAPDAKISEAVR